MEMKKLGWNFVANKKQVFFFGVLCFCFYKVHFRKYGYKQKKIQDNSHEIACGKQRPIKFLEIKTMFN
jgi:hypothetical protein